MVSLKARIRNIIKSIEKVNRQSGNNKYDKYLTKAYVYFTYPCKTKSDRYNLSMDLIWFYYDFQEAVKENGDEKFLYEFNK